MQKNKFNYHKKKNTKQNKVLKKNVNSYNVAHKWVNWTWPVDNNLMPANNLCKIGTCFLSRLCSCNRKCLHNFWWLIYSLQNLPSTKAINIEQKCRSDVSFKIVAWLQFNIHRGWKNKFTISVVEGNNCC